MPKLDIQLIQKRFMELFGTKKFFMHEQLSKDLGSYHFSLPQFYGHAKSEWGYTEEEHGSLSDFVKSEFGEEAQKFIEFLISN